MSVTLLESDDVTTAIPIDFDELDSGDTSPEFVKHLWNDKGGFGATIQNVAALAMAEYPYGSGKYVESGHPVVDDQYIQIAIDGNDDTGDSTMSPFSGGFTPVGRGVWAPIPDIPGGCARFLKVRAQIPILTGSTQLQFRAKIRIRFNDLIQPLVNVGYREGCGVLRHLGDRLFTDWLAAPRISGYGTDTLTASARSWVFRGVEYSAAEDSVTLNQNDGSSVALSSGYEYKAVWIQPLTGGASSTVKSNRATTGNATLPSVPSGYKLIRKVLVSYHSGSSVISSGDVTGTTYDGLLTLSAGDGLVVNVGAGGCVVPGALYFTNAGRQASVPDDATQHVWLKPSGALALTDDTEPATEGDVHLGEETAAGGVITSVTPDEGRFRNLAAGGDAAKLEGHTWEEPPDIGAYAPPNFIGAKQFFGTVYELTPVAGVVHMDGQKNNAQIFTPAADTLVKTSSMDVAGEWTYYALLVQATGTDRVISFDTNFANITSFHTGTDATKFWLIEMYNLGAANLMVCRPSMPVGPLP